jgi:zinc/manganese transport system permease protein
VRAGGVRALASVGIVTAALLGLAGRLLLAFPAMDHPWLDGLEESVPAVRLAFLDAEERQAHADSRQAIDEGLAELARVRRIQPEARWGTRPLSDEMQERVRQYLAGRTEPVTGDRLVLRALEQRARQRQRFLLGVPMAVGAPALGVASARAHRQAPTSETPGGRSRTPGRGSAA